MKYTLWSRGRMLGETDLGFVQIYSNLRMGWFHPSPVGETFMPVLTGCGPALKKISRMMRNPLRELARAPQHETPGEYPVDIRRTTAYADLVSTVDELEAMELQMRDPDGVVMEIEHVGVDDMEFKKSWLTKRERRLFDAPVESWEPEPEPFPRYQIQVYFPGPRLNLIDPSEIG